MNVIDRTNGSAGVLRILGGGAAHGLVAALTPKFSNASGFDVGGDYGAVGGMRQRLIEGEQADVAILTAAILAQLGEGGIVEPGSVRSIGAVTTAVAVRASDPAPAIATAEELREALLAADAIYFPDPALATAGIHFQSVLTALDIFSTVRDRLRTYPNGATAMKALANAPERRPIGCTQTTEIVGTGGLKLLGDLPPPHGLSTVYAAGLVRQAGNPAPGRAAAAGALIALLCAESSASTRIACGFRE